MMLRTRTVANTRVTPAKGIGARRGTREGKTIGGDVGDSLPSLPAEDVVPCRIACSTQRRRVPTLSSVQVRAVKVSSLGRRA